MELVFLAMGDVDEHEKAIEELKIAEEKGEKSIRLHSGIAWNLGQLSKHEEAIEILKKVEELGRESIWLNSEWDGI